MDAIILTVIHAVCARSDKPSKLRQDGVVGRKLELLKAETSLLSDRACDEKVAADVIAVRDL
jgi:hypothetical protein